MDILLVALVAFLASGLTLFSGFGLGTILMPTFALLMPVEVVAAVIVDATRLSVYGLSHITRNFAVLTPDVWTVVGVATLCAFLGAFIGSRILSKVTLRGVQITVALTMIALGLGVATGLI